MNVQRIQGDASWFTVVCRSIDIALRKIIIICIDKDRAWESCSELFQQDFGATIEPPHVAVDELDAFTIWASLVVELGGNASQWTHSEDEYLACP